MEKIAVHSENAPKAIGTYSQAIKVGDTIYLSGQIPLKPHSMELISDDFTAATRQVLDNLSAVAKAAGGKLDDIVKLQVYLLDLENFVTVNELMKEYFTAPYPARAAVQVAALPKGAVVEMDAILVLT